jgi:hypothetical protein
MAEVSEKEYLTHQIKMAFILESVDNQPDIIKIMKKFALLDVNGNSTGLLSEFDVREKMAIEKWDQLRMDNNYRIYEVIPGLLRFINRNRDSELQKLIYDDCKLIAADEMRFMKTGETAKSDGSIGSPCLDRARINGGVISSMAYLFTELGKS